MKLCNFGKVAAIGILLCSVLNDSFAGADAGNYAIGDKGSASIDVRAGKTPSGEAPSEETGANDETVLLKVGPYEIKSDLKTTTNNFPWPLNGLINDYSTILGMQNYSLSGKIQNSNVGSANYGLRKYLGELIQNDSLLKKELVEFYSAVRQITDKYDFDIKCGAGASRRKKEGLCMYYEAGKPPLENLKPGWVWKLALQTTLGDANRAMRVIAFCGHDDVGQVDNYSIFASCPFESSVFYARKSLGEEFDIDKTLEKKILKLNGATLNNSYEKRELRPQISRYMGAKYYHLYGSAFVTCEMISKGHNPEIVKRFQPFLAKAYRLATLKHLGDSEALAKQWTFPLTEKYPITDLRVKYFDDSNIKFIRNTFRKKPEGWSQEKFTQGRIRYNLVMMDFEWTQTQHALGAEFAAQHCVPEVARPQPL